MLRGLVEAGVRPDVVVGTSVGSLNGAALAHDPSVVGVNHLEQVWVGISRERLFADGRLTRAWRLASRASHLWGNEGLAEVIDGFGVVDFSELAVPLRVVATDLATGEEAVFAAGPLKAALLASCGLPGLYAPIEHDGRPLRCVARSAWAGAGAFHAGGCGLRCADETPIGGVFDAGGTMLRVRAVPERKPAGYTVAGWRVDDIAAAIHELGGGGVVSV